MLIFRDEPPQYQTSSASASFNSMNKIHDDCKPTVVLIFLAFKFGPILMYISSQIGMCYSMQLPTAQIDN